MHHAEYNADTVLYLQCAVCSQVKQLVERAYRRAKDCLTQNIEVLHKVRVTRGGVRIACSGYVLWVP